MKKLVLGILLVILFTASSFAQKRQGGKRMEAQKVAFITNYIDLSPEEAETFWPTYKQFQKDKVQINKKYKLQKRLADMNEEELEEQILLDFQKDQEQLDLKKEYFKKMKEVLPIRKIAMLRVAEREFRNTVLETIKERRKERRKNRMNGNN